MLDSIAKSLSTKDVTWICTDQHPSTPNGRAIAHEYARAAEIRGCRFFSIVLNCEAEENETRVMGRAGPANRKLTNPMILRGIREKEDVYHFGIKEELEIDVTARPAKETAQAIHKFMLEC